MPEISIIIPTFNSYDYICSAINSVLSQTYKDFEIIIIDDGSIDDTKEVLTKYNGKIRYLYQENQGVASARNLGIRESKGEYIAFLDSDDLWIPDKLAIQMDVFNKKPDIGLVCSSCIEFNENKKLNYIIRPRNFRGCSFKDLFLENFIQTSTVVTKKESFQKVGLFDERLKVAEDYDMWLRIARYYPVHFIKEPLVRYRINEKGLLKTESQYITLAHIHIFKKYLLDNNILVSNSLKRQRLAKEYYKLGKLKFYFLDIKEARSNIFKSVSISKSVGLIFKNTRNPIVNLIAFLKPYFILVYLHLLALFCREKGQTRIKNILYLEGGTGFGGSSNSLYRLLKNLDKTKFNPIVISFGKGPNIENIRDLGIEIIIKKPRDSDKFKLLPRIFAFGFFYSTFPFTLFLLRFMRSKHIDLVDLNTNVASGAPALLAAKLLRIPCISHMRGYGKYTNFEKKLFKVVDRYICVSNYLRDILITKYNIGQQKIKTIYDGLDLDSFKPKVEKNRLREELNLEPNLPLIGIVSRLMLRKGQDDFIRAAKFVLSEFPETKFLIVGDNPEDNGSIKAYLKEIVDELGVSKNIIFLGWRKDITDILSLLDISVFASRMREGFGNVIMESMALGIPVVATNIGGCPELIKPGQSGLLVEPSNPQKLAEAIISLLRNQELALKISENEKLRASKLFDIRRVVSETENIYEELLNDR